MGALVEHGIVQSYLDDHCNYTDYMLCEYKDSLPDKAWMFLWNEDSPFYKMGGWSGTKEEFNEIIFNTITTPKYIGLHIKESLKATADQLTKFKIGDGNGAFGEETLLYKRISKYFEHEISTYESSLQNNQNFSFLSWYNAILIIIILISIISLLIVFYKLGNLDKKLLSVISIVILGIIINAWVCGTMANAIDRLGTKVIWLLPLMALIGTLNIWNKRAFANKT
ncbi:MAG: hypothetical protein Kow0079_01430 [Vicingaceae bacterium]